MAAMVPALLALLAAASPPAKSAVSDLERGHRAFRAGDYDAAARALATAPARLAHNRDYGLYLLAESEFFAGRPDRARAAFSELARLKGSRFAAIAPWRVADCHWAAGRRAEAAAAYRRLLGSGPRAGDAAVARFRLAEVSEPRAREEARRLYLQVHLEHPAHPLADEAARRAAALGPAPAGGAATDGPALAPRDRLKRAAALAAGKRYEEALAELARLPPDLPPDLRARGDFEAGMAKYRMRRDYDGASKLLLGAVPHLPAADAASAAFHGARALSRVDRDDDAIAGYGRVVQTFPTSRWAAEAQFLAGWLEFNRGRFREAQPGLRQVLARFSRSTFAADAAWFLTLAHHFAGQPQEALGALDQHVRLARMSDPEIAQRAQYWRARILARLGKSAESRTLLRGCVERWPLDYYGLLARAQLKAAGEEVPVVFPVRAPAAPPPAPPRDPLLARVQELLRAGLDEEAGVELARGESALEKRVGRDRALPLLIEWYGKTTMFSRAHVLAEVRGGVVLASAPTGTARLYWEAAYPRAYESWVKRHAAEGGAPPLFLWSIMRKESRFAPYETSRADARGLLQLIPDAGAQAAARLDVPFFGDELYDPETNIRLGATFIGALYKRFGEQPFLAAGAYNGGTRPMVRWCQQHGGRPLEEFMELVTYRETREYMKRVIGIYARYLYLYDKKVYELPARIELPPVAAPGEGDTPASESL